MWQMLVRFLLAFNEGANNAVDEAVPQVSARIVGGDLTKVEHIPYLVNIRRSGIFECGGSLITPKCVLTAAHCVKAGLPQDFTVRGGVTYLSDFRNSRGVGQIFVPRQFTNKTLDHDVAVFVLKTILKGVHIDTIALGEATPSADQLVQVSGWGLTSETATNPSNQMRTVQLRVMPQKKCQNLYKDYRNVTKAMFCASMPGRKDACSADSGGPAVNNNGQLVGVVSWGKGYECGRSETPGVYVNIKEVRSWIEDIAKRHCQ